MSHEYIKNILSNSTVDDFVKNVDESNIDDLSTRAIVSTLKNSILALNLKFNPIQLGTHQNKSLEANQPHKQ